MRSTLILNVDFTPLSIIPISAIKWQDAIKQSYLGTNKTLEYYDDWTVRSPSITMNVPSIMITSTFVHKKHSVQFSRINLLIRDDMKCQYCEKNLALSTLTIDHVIPKVKGGTTNWANVVSCCYRCNSLKGHKNNMYPIHKPTKPDYSYILNKAKKLPIKVPDPKWIDYLGWDKNLVKIIPPVKNKLDIRF